MKTTLDIAPLFHIAPLLRVEDYKEKWDALDDDDGEEIESDDEGVIDGLSRIAIRSENA